MNKGLMGLAILWGFLLIGCSSGRFANYVSTNKDKLMDGDEELRFVSFNIPNLHYIEDQLVFTEPNPWRLPDEYEIRDALNTVKQLGGKVARTYVLSVRKPGESKKIIRHVEAPGIFNEEAFRALDKVMQIANEVGIRIIVPFVDNWWWWGGPVEYAAFRGKTKEEFWTDPQLIEDVKKTIEFLINRRNTYTGVLYKEDKAIFGWETGNELEAPYSWTAEIARYIKSLDKNHIVIEGTHNNTLTPEAINDPHIDVLSTHHYTRADVSVQRIKNNRELSKGKKPYFIGEFGLVPPMDIKAVVDTVLNNDISGIMIWSLRFHNRDGGFYLHRENTGSGPYRFPGFASGDIYNEREIINFMRQKAYEVDGREVPPLEIPDAPKLLDIPDVYSIAWQGSSGASSYSVERRKANEDKWITAGQNIHDADGAYRPLFMDTTALVNDEYFYRVTAHNESGSSEPSNEVGPVKVNSLKIIDELKDESKIYMKTGHTELVSFKNIYKFKEDNSRLMVDSGATVIYSVPEDILSFKLYLFTINPVCTISLLSSFTVPDSVSTVNEADSVITTKIETFPPYKNHYGFYTPVMLTCEEFPVGTKFVKILFNGSAHISRTEIEYSGNKIQSKKMVNTQ